MSDGSKISVGGIQADIEIDDNNLDATLEKIRRALVRVDQRIGEVQTAMTKAGADTAALTDRLNHLTDIKESLIAKSQELKEALDAESTAQKRSASATKESAAAKKAAADAADRLRARVQGASLAAISASRAFQDVAQSGFAAALNNLEFIFGGVGQAMGLPIQKAMMLGAAVQGVATAAYLAYENWDKLQEIIGVGFAGAGFEGLKALETQLKAVNKEIDDLRTKSRMTVAQIEALAKAETRAKALGGAIGEEKAVESLKGGSKDEKARGSAFTDAIREQGEEASREALTEHYRQKADAEGVNIGRRDIDVMLQEKGFNRDEIGAGDVNTLSEMFGVKMNARDMQTVADNGGDNIGKQVISALAKEKFLPDASTGEMVTAGQMARRRIKEGTEGNTDAIKEIGEVLDKALRGTGVSSSAAGPVIGSKFSEEYQANSPEGKEAVKAEKVRNDREVEAEKSRNKEESEAADAVMDDLDESNRQWQQYKQKKKQKRQQNERDSREAAPGVGSMAEFLAGSALAGEMTPDQARKQIADYLKENGRSEEEAKAASEDIYSDAQKDVREGVIKRALNSKGEELGKVEQFDAKDVASRFQNSVGDSEAKKQTSLQERMEKHLDTLASRDALTVEIKKK